LQPLEAVCKADEVAAAAAAEENRAVLVGVRERLTTRIFYSTM
jgi:hypothetical protein